MLALSGDTLQSHIRTVSSTEHEANTYDGSVVIYNQEQEVGATRGHPLKIKLRHSFETSLTKLVPSPLSM